MNKVKSLIATELLEVVDSELIGKERQESINYMFLMYLKANGGETKLNQKDYCEYVAKQLPKCSNSMMNIQLFINQQISKEVKVENLNYYITMYVMNNTSYDIDVDEDEFNEYVEKSQSMKDLVEDVDQKVVKILTDLCIS